MIIKGETKPNIPLPIRPKSMDASLPQQVQFHVGWQPWALLNILKVIQMCLAGINRTPAILNACTPLFVLQRISFICCHISTKYIEPVLGQPKSLFRFPYPLTGKKTNELFVQPSITIPISKMSKLKQRMIHSNKASAQALDFLSPISTFILSIYCLHQQFNPSATKLSSAHCFEIVKSLQNCAQSRTYKSITGFNCTYFSFPIFLGYN